MDKRSILKVRWYEGEGGWRAKLVTSGADEYRSFPLTVGNPVSLEVTNERRCTGYASGRGQRQVCPRFAEIEQGEQCVRCRNQDVYTGYVEGRGSGGLQGSFTVYLAQCADTVKVGVTRDGRLPKRWIEQGADYGVKLAAGLSQQDALDMEESISNRGLPERIRKEAKQRAKPPSERITTAAEEVGQSVNDAEVVDVQAMTAYPSLSCRDVRREGRFVGDVQSVQGQIVSLDGQCMAMTSGRVIRRPRQQGLGDFT